MAKELGAGVSGSIEEQKQKEQKIIFIVLKLVMVVITIFIAGRALLTGFQSYQDTMQYESRKAELERQYATMKAEAEEWHATHDVNENPDDVDAETGVQIMERELYSARTAGVEIAALQNLYYQNKELLQDDRQRLNELTKSTKCWIGEGWDPAVTPIRWDFSTFYDATDKTYDVCWQCWHQAPSGTMYLIAVQFASFDGEAGTFKLGDQYRSDFFRMLDSKGAVEAGEPSDMDQSTQQMVNDLLQGGGTGSIPEGDPGQSASIMQNQDDGEDDGPAPDPNTLAGAPAGGGA